MKTVTIGIPAHNEESGIGILLDSIVSQKRTLFKLDKVIVVADGCTDQTAQIVGQYCKKYGYIELIDDGQRTGKSIRLNQIYKASKSDIIVTFDADTVLGHRNVINELVKEFKNENVALVGGNDLPNNPKNWVQKMAVVWIESWNESKLGYKNNISVNNHKGVVSALRSDLANKIKIPKNIVGDDDFIYFKAKILGYEFRFAKKATVYYTVPSELKDFFIQTTRFLSAKYVLAKYFGDWIYDEYKIPFYLKLRAFLVVYLHEPIYFPLAILFQILQRILKNSFRDNYSNGFWMTVNSTKKNEI